MDTLTVSKNAQDKEVQQALLDVTTDFNLTQVHDQPTRENNLLDLIFTSNTSLIKSTANAPGISDHAIVVADSDTKPVYTKQKPRKCLIYSKAKWDEIEIDCGKISQRVTSLSQTGSTVDCLWDTFKNELKLTVDKNIPSRTKKANTSTPWLNRKLKKMLKRKATLYKKAKTTNNWVLYRDYQKHCKREMRNAEWKHVNEIINEGLKTNNTKPFWRYVNARKQDNIGVAPLKEKGQLYSDSKTKAELLIKQFESVFTKEQQDDLPEFPTRITETLTNPTITEQGVYKLLHKLNPSKAGGPDELPSKVLQHCAKELAPAVSTIFQTSINTGQLPTDWRNAHVTPVYKKGDRHQPENYRPVSLTCILTKLLEHIICRHIMQHLEKHKALTSLNHGFRSGYSCESQLIVTTHDLLSKFDSNTQVDTIILDFSKAFDTVPHKKLLLKLNAYGIRGSLHTWISNFLMQRQMSVVVDGEQSSSVKVGSGVPQGTVLGPLLFLCHINDLKDHAGSQYGQIHVCVRELVEEKFGADAWKTILAASGLDENDHFMVFHKYDDPTTFKLIGAVCEVLGVELPTVLEIFGEYFLTYCLRHGYDKMLKTLGSNFKSFIQNLDSLHSLLALSYKNIVAPSFRCETNPEDNSLALHYYTVRPGLYPIVLGLVKAVARDLYNQSAEISVVSINQELLEEDKIQEHVTFKVTLNDMLEDTKSLAEFHPSFPSEFHISAEQFCRVFPYHVIFDSDLRIKQCGYTIQRQLRRSVTNEHMSDIFELVHPRIGMAVINFRMFINAVFMMKIKPSSAKYNRNGKTSNQGLTLKGQMMWLEDTKHMIFISSPRLSSLTELMEMDVYLADIPLYDVTRELVLLNQQRIAEIDIAKQLDETTIELRKISKALEEEKKKTDELLYQMLPERVANDLKNGKTIEAEKFEQVTILFSDIVTFTNIAAACSAMDVVEMLNDLYHRFDTSTNAHGVYKVETIGDAYMIVCGVPIKTTHHAQPVANFAMDMVTEAAHVMSPATGKPLQIRIGVHTGPVVAGVVGKKMPRYCLFGDTVNTASRMESHGVPGRIHVSPTTYSCLNDSGGFKLRFRGEIGVKGKGQMTTFFLVGSNERCLVEPKDDYLTLPVVDEMKVKPRIVNPKITKQSSSVKLKTLGSPQISVDTVSGGRSTNSEPRLVQVVQHVMNGNLTDSSDGEIRTTNVMKNDANDTKVATDISSVSCDNNTESISIAINRTDDNDNKDNAVINDNALNGVKSSKTTGFEDKRNQLTGDRNQRGSVERAISGLCTVL